VHYSFLPVIGGVELVLAQHARLFANAGHTVTILCGRGAARTALSENTGAKPKVIVIAELDATSEIVEAAQAEVLVGSPGAAFGKARARVRAAIAPLLQAQDVVIVHNVLTMHFHLALTSVLWDLADEWRNVRFLCWVHDLALCNPDYTLPPADRAPWRLLAQAHPHITYVAVSPLRVRQFAALTNQPSDRCRAIANGVDPLIDLPSQLSALEQRHALACRDFLLLQPVRLLRRKNVEFTLEVIAAIKSLGHTCGALVTAPPDVHHAASADYEQELRIHRDRLGLEEDVFFLSEHEALTSAHLGSLFQFADALFFPSRQEGFGIPLLEAALHRLPIFCADIEPLNGLLSSSVTTFSPNAQAAAVAALIVEKLGADAAFHARKETLRRYTWAGIYESAIAPLLAEPNQIKS
jgi:glycosyltransferase involved in cell wall biosynthesis